MDSLVVTIRQVTGGAYLVMTAGSDEPAYGGSFDGAMECARELFRVQRDAQAQAFAVEALGQRLAARDPCGSQAGG